MLARYVAEARIRKPRCPVCADQPVNHAEMDAAPSPPSREVPTQDWDLTMRRRGRVRPPSSAVPLADLAKDLPFDGRMAAAGPDRDDEIFSRLGASELPAAPGRVREPGEDDE